MKTKPLDQGFYQYLQQKSYVVETVQYYCYNAYYYQEWLKTQSLTVPKATYNHLMNYIAHLQAKGINSVMINKQLKSIELYYTYLKLPNIAVNVRVKSSYQHARLFLTEKELSTLYTHYKSNATTYYQYSDKLLLSITKLVFFSRFLFFGYKNP